MKSTSQGGKQLKQKTCPLYLTKIGLQKLYKLVKIFHSLCFILFMKGTIQKTHRKQAELLRRIHLFKRNFKTETKMVITRSKMYCYC